MRGHVNGCDGLFVYCACVYIVHPAAGLSRADTLLHEMAHMWFGEYNIPLCVVSSCNKQLRWFQLCAMVRKWLDLGHALSCVCWPFCAAGDLVTMHWWQGAFRVPPPVMPPTPTPSPSPRLAGTPRIADCRPYPPHFVLLVTDSLHLRLTPCPGLWLNESLVSYLSAVCVAEATRFGSQSWVQFSLDMKVCLRV